MAKAAQAFYHKPPRYWGEVRTHARTHARARQPDRSIRAWVCVRCVFTCLFALLACLFACLLVCCFFRFVCLLLVWFCVCFFAVGGPTPGVWGPRSRCCHPVCVWGGGRMRAWRAQGGSIPFMGMLGRKFPGVQFVITGVLGPRSNAHGPNEFLHVQARRAAHVHSCTHAHARAHTHTHTRAYTHTRTYTYTRTHRRAHTRTFAHRHARTPPPPRVPELAAVQPSPPHMRTLARRPLPSARALTLCAC